MNNARHQTTAASALDKRHSNAADLFPDTLPPIMPAMLPQAGSRADEALSILMKGPTNQADYPGNGWRLAAYIQSLEYLGWRFIVRLVTKPGCRRQIAEYRLDLTDPRTIAGLALRAEVK